MRALEDIAIRDWYVFCEICGKPHKKSNPQGRDNFVTVKDPLDGVYRYLCVSDRDLACIAKWRRIQYDDNSDYVDKDAVDRALDWGFATWAVESCAWGNGHTHHGTLLEYCAENDIRWNLLRVRRAVHINGGVHVPGYGMLVCESGGDLLRRCGYDDDDEDNILMSDELDRLIALVQRGKVKLDKRGLDCHLCAEV
jgi:hypothetical protein